MFSTVLPYEIIKDTNNEIVYQFQYNQIFFHLNFRFQQVEQDKTVCIVSFYELDSHGDPNVDQTNKHKTSVLLFSTIVNIIKQTQEKWDALIFVSEGDSRVGLYSGLLKRFSTFENYVFKSNVGTLFVVSKQQLPQEIKQQLIQTSQEYFASK